jgi:hypothetical protein
LQGRVAKLYAVITFFSFSAHRLFTTLQQPRRFHPIRPGPRQRIVSTFLKSGASVRSVAKFLKSSARSRCSPRTFDGLFDRTVAIQELGSGRGADPRDAGITVDRIAYEREQVRNQGRIDVYNSTALSSRVRVKGNGVASTHI